VINSSLYYDARSENHQTTLSDSNRLCCTRLSLFCLQILTYHIQLITRFRLSPLQNTSAQTFPMILLANILISTALNSKTTTPKFTCMPVSSLRLRKLTSGSSQTSCSKSQRNFKYTQMSRDTTTITSHAVNHITIIFKITRVTGYLLNSFHVNGLYFWSSNIQ
jgi:hypothetical protein